MEKIYVVTCSPYWREYTSMRSPKKAFRNEEDAQKYIDEEEKIEQEQTGNYLYVSHYQIDEIDLM